MPLEHAQRLELAHTLTAEFTARHRTVLAGQYGSTARGTDTPWSDLELLFVIEDGETAQDIAALYAGTVIGARVHTVSQVVYQVGHPGAHWPMTMGILSVLQVLRGDASLPAQWLAMGQAVPPAAFRDALAALAPGLVFESCARISSCALRDSRPDLAAAILETLLEMGTALCLLNRQWVQHDYYEGMLDSLRFPVLPERYATLAPALWHCDDPRQAAPLAQELLQNYVALLDEHGLLPQDWSDVAPEEWPL